MAEAGTVDLAREAFEVVKERQPFMRRSYPRIRDAMRTPYGLPGIDPLRYECCLCLFFGLHQAAITLTNHFLENLLKFALITHASIKRMASNPPPKRQALKTLRDIQAAPIKMHGDKNLQTNIDRACSVGLITKEEKKLLGEFRENYRNAYAHADKGKTFGDASVPITVFRLSAGGVEEDSSAEVSVADFPMIQGIAQAASAEANAADYFLCLDGVARAISKRLFPCPPEAADPT